MTTVWHDVGQRLREVARAEARAATPPVRRFKVRSTGPLVLDEVAGDLTLEEGDPDFEVHEHLLPGNHVIVQDPEGDWVGYRHPDALPKEGDMVAVTQTPDGDYVASHLLRRSEEAEGG